MDFDDYKISPENFEQMAKAYHTTLSLNDFRFVKIKNNQDEKQKVIDEISCKFSRLNNNIDYIKKTKKARTHPKQIQNITKRISLCRQSCNFADINTYQESKNLNQCETLKEIIEICAEIVALCNFLAEFSRNEIDDKICATSQHLLEVIKDTASLFGECHFRY